MLAEKCDRPALPTPRSAGPRGVWSLESSTSTGEAGQRGSPPDASGPSTDRHVPPSSSPISCAQRSPHHVKEIVSLPAVSVSGGREPASGDRGDTDMEEGLAERSQTRTGVAYPQASSRFGTPPVEPRRSLGWPILLGVVLIGSIIALGVGWVLVSIAAALGSKNAAFYWAVLGVGVALLVLVLIGVIVYLALTVKAIALSQRQSNFIDSVTHELKSPLASLKLYLQTLTRRSVPPEQQADFHRFMLQDVERLDTLIDHLLDAAKTLQRRPSAEDEVSPLLPVLERASATAVQRHGVPAESVRLVVDSTAAPLVVRAREADLEIVFRNLVDNAVKYSLPLPAVEVTAAVASPGRVRVRVADNGPGIPVSKRTQVFRRFVRLGSELERSTPGTGLGLFLVKSLVKQMRGRVDVRGRLPPPGTVFEVELPAG